MTVYEELLYKIDFDNGYDKLYNTGAKSKMHKSFFNYFW